MEISETQYEQIAHCLPVQRGNVRLSNLQFSMPFCMSPNRAAHGGASPSILDPGTRSTPGMMRWAKSGVLDQVFEALQARHIIQIKIEAVSLDSTIIKVHPEGTGA